MHSADHSTSDRPATALGPDYRAASARIHLAVLGIVALAGLRVPLCEVPTRKRRDTVEPDP